MGIGKLSGWATSACARSAASYALDQGDRQFTNWIVKGYRLGLKDNLPAIMNPLADLTGFAINDVVEIPCKVLESGAAFRLQTDYGGRPRFTSIK